MTNIATNIVQKLKDIFKPSPYNKTLLKFGIKEKEVDYKRSPDLRWFANVEEQNDTIKGILFDKYPDSEYYQGNLVWIDQNGEKYMVNSIDIRRLSEHRTGLVIDLNNPDSVRKL